MSATTRPLGERYASLSLDLDNKWSYLKIRGDPAWQEYPTYLDILVPRIVDLMRRLELSISVFVVGRDAADPRNHDMLELFHTSRHELANHSLNHESWLDRYTREELRREILEAEELIARIAGVRPVGFRGPGFSWSGDLLSVLSQAGYLYDATILPTWIGVLARMYYFRTAQLTEEQKEERTTLFGGSLDVAVKPLKPYYWQLDPAPALLEIPVTTMPLFRVPFHMSYLLFLSGMSERVMMIYLRMALSLCRLTRTAPSFLLHPLDFLGGDEVPELSFFPGMTLPGERKRELVERVLIEIKKNFEVVNMSTHARRAVEGGGIRHLALREFPVGT